jgi:hypothetical protein
VIAGGMRRVCVSRDVARGRGSLGAGACLPAGEPFIVYWGSLRKP